MQKKWSNLTNEYQINTGDIVKNLYPTFNKYKFEFNKNYDMTNMQWIDFDKFYESISPLNKVVEKFISINFNNIEWDLADTDDWILKCFYIYKGKNVTNDGYVINLIKNNQFEKGFCAELKTILENEIKQKQRKNRQHKSNYYYMEDEKMNELEDLKDYLSGINNYVDYLSFANKYLTKKELLVFSLVLNKVFIEDEILDSEIIKKELNLSNSNYKKLIMNIRNKYKKYKSENN